MEPKREAKQTKGKRADDSSDNQRKKKEQMKTDEQMLFGDKIAAEKKQPQVGQKRLRKLSDNTHEADLKRLGNDATKSNELRAKVQEPEESKVKTSSSAVTKTSVE